MSDRQNDVLARIDAETAKCICGRTIPADGPSLDYCSDVCQYRYAAGQAGTEPDPELLYSIPPAETDGRAINAAVNSWVDSSSRRPSDVYWDETHHYTRQRPVDRYTMGRASYHNPPSISMRVPMRNGAREAETDWIDISRFVVSIEGPVLAGARRAELERERRITDLHAINPQQADRYLEECNGDPTQAICFAQSGIAPSTVRLARALGIGPWQLRVMAESIPGRVEEAIRWAAGTLTPSEPDPPATAEEFRRRALEHQQNRGTGPTRSDNRRWRTQ